MMSMTHLISILIGFHIVYTSTSQPVGREMFRDNVIITPNHEF